MSSLFDEVVKEGEANVPLLVMHVRNYLVFSIAWYFLELLAMRRHNIIGVCPPTT